MKLIIPCLLAGVFAIGSPELKICDTMVADGYRAKDGSHLIDARRVTLPDGRSIYGGSPGDGGPGDNATDQGNLPGSGAKKN